MLYTLSRTPWTGNQSVAVPSPIQGTIPTRNGHTMDTHLCLEWDSNPRSQGSSERKTVYGLDCAATVIGLLFLHILIDIIYFFLFRYLWLESIDWILWRRCRFLCFIETVLTTTVLIFVRRHIVKCKERKKSSSANELPWKETNLLFVAFYRKAYTNHLRVL
jgi:hypothetical protein